MNATPPVSLWPDPDALGPVTDLYQLTMMAGYHATGMSEKRATFELFVRRLPPHRAYLVFAGLEQAIGDLLRLAFSPRQLEDIARWPVFSQVDPSFFRMLETLRFEGDVWAVPEGTVVFAGEPLVRITAPLPQAQWVETFLLASLGYPTLVASRAARMVMAAAGRPLYDFGARRGHGPQAGLLAARASYLAGFEGTSHVEAARRLDIPAIGTMAHSWVQSFETESEAFAAFARVFPGRSTLLVDTYETLEGVRHAAAVSPPVPAIRLDSGDLDILSRQARAILDGYGRKDTRIVASGDLEEHTIARLVCAGAPIDAFGIGTELITSRDTPSLSMVYKLVELEGQGRFKLSPGKRSFPMAKQVYRRCDPRGRFLGDLVTRADEAAEGPALMVPIVRSGRFLRPVPTLEQIRTYHRNQIAALPEPFKSLENQPDYSITYSELLEADARRIMEQGGDH